MIDDEKIRQLNIARRLVLCTLIVYVFVFVAMNSPYLTVDNARRVLFSVSKALKENVSDNPVITFEESDQNSYGIFKNGFVILNQKNISIYSHDNFLISRHNLNFSNPVMKISGNHILCFDRGGTSLYLLDSFDILHTREFPEGIVNASLDDEGHVSVITDAFGYKGKVSVLNQKLEDLFYWYSSSYYLLDAAFAGKNIIGVVSIVPDRENTNVVYQQLNYKTNEVVSTCTAADRFPVGIAIKENKTVEILSDSDIISVNGDTYTQTYQHVNESIDFFIQEKNYTVITKLKDAATNTYSVEVLEFHGNVLFEKNFVDVRSACSYGNAVLILSENVLYVLDSVGTIVYSEEVDSSVNRLLSDGKSVFAVSPNSAWQKDIAFVFDQ